MPSITKQHCFNGNLSQVYQGIRSYDKYQDHIQVVNNIEVRPAAAKDSTAQVRYEIQVIKTLFYTLDMFEQPESKISWQLAESNIMKKNEGYWEFTETSDNSVDATYHLDVGFRGLVPGAVTKGLTATQLPAMFEQMQALIDACR